MGWVTALYLADRSAKNIAYHNQKLKEFGVAKCYRFYSEADIRLEYKSFLTDNSLYPLHTFPKAEINSYDDFKKFWNPVDRGEVFVPYIGSLTFDCYFGRMSNRAMYNVGRYIKEHKHDLLGYQGSLSTLFEKAFSDKQMLKIKYFLREGELKKKPYKTKH
jgi:hypothetical protein